MPSVSLNGTNRDVVGRCCSSIVGLQLVAYRARRLGGLPSVDVVLGVYALVVSAFALAVR
jgi:hypothetical protein